MEGVRAAVRFLPRAWARPWFAGLLAASLLAMAAVLWLVGPASSVAVTLAGVLIMPLLQAPLYRLAIGGETPGSFMAMARRYLRLVAVNLLTDIFLFVPALLLFVAALAVVYGLAFSQPGFDPRNAATWISGGPVLTGLEVILAIGAAALAWLLARVSLGPAATVAEGRVQMLSTWPLTRGRGWRIVTGRLVLALPVIAVLMGGYFAADRVGPGERLGAMALLAANLVTLGLWLPLQVGMMAYFYERRAPLPPPAAR